MAKGAMKAGKEARKPKKDAKKPAAAPTLKAPPVKATKLKDMYASAFRRSLDRRHSRTIDIQRLVLKCCRRCC